MNIFDIKKVLASNQYHWLITGVAGFIGSNLLEMLLANNQKVIGLDNFSTGSSKNLIDVQDSISSSQWNNFNFIEGDICNIHDCKTALKSVDFVLHQAALGSVPRSIENPIATNESNISGFLNMLYASKEANIKSFTFAASSSTYGDHKELPKKEEIIGKPLSPYAVTKYVNELYADVFFKAYNFKTIGLRYFNVFGKRQDPNGAYAAVIPKWINAMINKEDVYINGDGETSRDFCYVKNAVEANILATFAPESSKNHIYNIAVGDRTSLNELYQMIKSSLKEKKYSVIKEPVFRNFRDGDVRHSQADITKAKEKLGYDPQYDIGDGINEAIQWYLKNIIK